MAIREDCSFSDSLALQYNKLSIIGREAVVNRYLNNNFECFCLKRIAILQCLPNSEYLACCNKCIINIFICSNCGLTASEKR